MNLVTGQISGRRMGRTSRMIAEALKLEATTGRAVYIVAENAEQVAYLRGRIPRYSTIKVDTAEGLGFNWMAMTVPRAHPNCTFLADHHSIESRFEKMLQMLHRWDGEV